MIGEKYGFTPQTTNVLSDESFYFYLTVKHKDKVFSLGIPDDFSVASFNRDLDATLKRLAPGFLKTIGLYSPISQPVNPMFAQYGVPRQGKQFTALREKLEENYRTESVDLNSGNISSEIDTLIVMAPKELKARELFAIDQYLMKGATVILATSPISVSNNHEGFLSAHYESGLKKWLEHHGAKISNKLVMDEQNSEFPDVRKRNIHGMTIKEAYLAPYPLFVDVRESGLNKDLGITSGLEQVIIPWASPITIDKKINKNRIVTPLVMSSNKSWITSDISIETNRDLYPKFGFKIQNQKQPSLLSVMIEGEFSSYFKGKKSPLLLRQKNKDNKQPNTIISSVIEKSPKSSRLIIIASNEFVSDNTIRIESMVNDSRYLNALQLVENSVDWSVQDHALLSMKNRRHFARTLFPLEDQQKRNWEMFNYIFALLGLTIVYGLHRYLKMRSAKRYRELKLA